MCDFSEIEQSNVKEGKNIWKFGEKYTKFENVLKKSRWFHAIIVRNKLLVKALEQVARHWCFPNVYGIMEPGLILMEFAGKCIG